MAVPKVASHDFSIYTSTASPYVVAVKVARHFPHSNFEKFCAVVNHDIYRNCMTANPLSELEDSMMTASIEMKSSESEAPLRRMNRLAVYSNLTWYTPGNTWPRMILKPLMGKSKASDGKVPH